MLRTKIAEKFVEETIATADHWRAFRTDNYRMKQIKSNILAFFFFLINNGFILEKNI